MKSETDLKLEKIGSHLRRLRQEKNDKLTTVHLATGISIGVISEIENGKHYKVCLVTLSKLAHHYNSSLDEILSA